MKETKQYQPLYRRLLGKKYEILPKPVQELHDLHEQAIYAGSCNIERGNTLLARLIATFLSLPAPGENVPITLQFTVQNGVEHWTRSFGNKKFYSRQWKVKNDLYERLPLTTLVFTPIVSDNKLELEIKQIYILGLPVLSLLSPTIIARETEENGHFRFHVHVTLPYVGLLVMYEGFLEKRG